MAIKDGESIEIDYLTRENRPRAIAIQVSGDPFQAYRMNIRIAKAILRQDGQHRLANCTCGTNDCYFQFLVHFYFKSLSSSILRPLSEHMIH